MIYLKKGHSSIFKYIEIEKNQYKLNKITKKREIEKTVKKLKKRGINKVILSKHLKENNELVNHIRNYDIKIIDGKCLMGNLLQDIVEYLKQKGKIVCVDEVSFLTNKLNSDVNQTIIDFIKLYKTIRIVTNYTEKFTKLEEDLYNRDGISIIISNNKRNALSKSRLIINYDFTEEMINQYNVYENAIIINLNEKIKINKKRFNGLIITDYEVKIGKTNTNEIQDLEEIISKQKEYFLKEILEEQIYNIVGNQPDFKRFEMIKNIIKNYNIKIENIFGLNGVIN